MLSKTYLVTNDLAGAIAIISKLFITMHGSNNVAVLTIYS